MKAFEPFPALLGDLYVASESQHLLFPRTGKKRMIDGRGLRVRRASRDLYASGLFISLQTTGLCARLNM